jgi:hypothetical protein
MAWQRLAQLVCCVTEKRSDSLEPKMYSSDFVCEAKGKEGKKERKNLSVQIVDLSKSTKF